MLLLENLVNSGFRKLEEISPEDCIILSHVDHDGFSSATLLNTYFQVRFGKTARMLYPRKFFGFGKILAEIKNTKPAFLVIVDSPLARYKEILKDILTHTEILNFDHHDILSVQHTNFNDFNPHLANVEFLNSSGLIWQIIRKHDMTFFGRRSWVGGIGAAQDYCLEDNIEMFKIIQEIDLIEKLDINSLLESRIMFLAKMIRASIQNDAQYAYDSLFNASLENNVEKLFENPTLKNSYEFFSKKFNDSSEFLKNTAVLLKEKNVNIKILNMKNLPINFVSDLCEKEKENVVYVAYQNGRLSFRTLFTNFDVRVLAKHFGGGGPNRRAAGANSKKSFEQIVKEISSILQQRTLS